jgi:MYXO-CTERM domain-containing protein
MTFLVLSLLACSDSSTGEGTIVGNPGQVAMVLAPADGLTFASASAAQLSVELTGCPDDEGFHRDTREDVDLLDIDIGIPPDPWCELRVLLEDVEVQGDGPPTSTFTLLLAPGDILFQDELFVAEGELLLLELGAPDWVTAGDLGLPSAGDVIVDASDPLADELELALEADSVLLNDIDGDGLASDDERADPIIDAEGDSQARDIYLVGPDGCGCSTRAPPTLATWWIAILALQVLLGRRPRIARRPTESDALDADAGDGAA